MCTLVSCIGSGSSHSAAVLDCNLALTWGCGDDGQLGHGSAESIDSPQVVSMLMDKKISAISCGAEYTVAISTDEDEVYSWGWGDFGRLGHGSPDDMFLPKSIHALKGLRVVSVACGDTHTLAVTRIGHIFSFGRNQNGQLGHGTTQDCLVPNKIVALSGRCVVQAACGAEHSIALTQDGKLHAWGWGRYGNLGNGDFEDSYSPREIIGTEDLKFTDVACGWRHSLAVSDSGALYSFGWNKYGQLGLGDADQFQSRATKVECLGQKQISVISGGWRHTMAADMDGILYAWGWGKFGQLGIGNVSDQSSPQVVSAIASERIFKVACGWRHSLALSSSGKVYAWGRGNNGQLGIGKCMDMALPRYIEALAPGQDRNDYLKRAQKVETEQFLLQDRYAVVPQGDDDEEGTVPIFEEIHKRQRLS